ncbi:MAG: hypothetical protein WBE72_12710 [Terracidiphilus sp.]
MKMTYRNAMNMRGSRSTALILPFSLILLAAGCGGSSGSPGSKTGPIAGESTTVAIQLSSAANDEFVHFNMTINSITLTNKAGVATVIFNTPTDVDFIPVNGNAAPFATVSVAQDVYTSAAVSVSNPRFSYVFMGAQGSITFSTDAYGYTPTPPVVNLAGPITVSGTAMGLTMSLQAAQSGSYAGVAPNQTYTINPTFDLTPFAIPAQATTPLNGKCIGLGAQVTSISADSMTATLAGNPLTGTQSVTAALNSSTVYQGIASASDLSAGSLVNMDIALEPDASYAATRVEVQDATATNIDAGQLVELDPAYNYLATDATEQQGNILTAFPVGMGYGYEFGGATSFLTSARFEDLSSLPFKANFSGSSLAAGQTAATGSTTIAEFGGTWTQPTSVMLMPQTIDAAVTGESTSGDYTVYTAQLAPYDLIVQMNSPLGVAASTLLPNANTVYVYVDSSASMLNSTPLAAGGTYRFDGLLFNDSGTLRMVADAVNDGVPQ